jgi:hypothetical protein
MKTLLFNSYNRYFGFLVGSDCFWLEKDVSLNVDTYHRRQLNRRVLEICVKDD